MNKPWIRRIVLGTVAIATVAAIATAVVIQRRNDGAWQPSAQQRTDHVVDLTDQPALDPRVTQSDDPIWRYSWVQPDDPGREGSWQIQRTLALLNARPGMNIVDVGAGAGWLTFRMAHIVGPEGMITATDKDLRMAQLLAFERQRRGLHNVRVLHVPPTVLGIPPASVDAVVMVGLGVLHSRDPDNDLGQIRRYVAQIASAIRPGGRFVYAAEFEQDPAMNRSGAESAALCAEQFEVERIDEQPPSSRRWGGRPLVGFVLSLRRR